MTLKEAYNEMNNNKNETWQERLRIANYLINYNHLIEAIQKVGRNKDKNDLEHL